MTQTESPAGLEARLREVYDAAVGAQERRNDEEIHPFAYPTDAGIAAVFRAGCVAQREIDVSAAKEIIVWAKTSTQGRVPIDGIGQYIAQKLSAAPLASGDSTQSKVYYDGPLVASGGEK